MLLDELKLARRSVGLSQTDLAKRIGVDAQTVKRMEKGIGSTRTVVAAMQALRLRLTGVAPGATLPEQLRARRLAHLTSLERVAARTGLSPTTVASVERGGGSIASLLKMLAALAPNARRRAPERSHWGEGDRQARDNRFTPPAFVEAVRAAFGEIDLDPCASRLSPVVARRMIILDEGGDGLVDDWSGDLAYMNPPFSRLLVWLRRAHDQWRAGAVKTVVCLVPARTDSALFHEVLSPVADIYLLKGRLNFLDPQGSTQPTPFSLMVVILGATGLQKERFTELVPGRWMSRVEDAGAP